MFQTNYLALVSAGYCCKYENTFDTLGNEAFEETSIFPSVN